MNRNVAVCTAATAGLAAVAALGVAAPAIARSAHTVHEGGHVTPLSKATPELVPAGARARVQSVELPDGRLRVTLHLQGFDDNHTYGAHVHTTSCSVNEGSGHYNIGGGVSPATEVWLDVRTNEAGNGHSTSEQSWQFGSTARPKSVIIHKNATNPGPADAGKAGDKLACLNVDF
jgi:Cu-Zn family superoxide dismutase